MPRISEFFGIAIYMYFQDHAPPHFHALYGGREAVVAIHPFRVLRGSLSRRTLALVKEWAISHRGELLQNWQKAQQGRPLDSVAPLE